MSAFLSIYYIYIYPTTRVNQNYYYTIVNTYRYLDILVTIMAHNSPDPHNTDTEEYVSDEDSDDDMSDRSDQMSTGSTEVSRDSEIYVTREDLEEWKTEIVERVQETRMTLSQLLPMCDVLKAQVLKDIQILRSLGTLLRPEETDSSTDSVEFESSEDERNQE